MRSKGIWDLSLEDISPDANGFTVLKNKSYYSSADYIRKVIKQRRLRLKKVNKKFEEYYY
jgi:hypothetical protein